jgi:hypothetical protein
VSVDKKTPNLSICYLYLPLLCAAYRPLDHEMNMRLEANTICRFNLMVLAFCVAFVPATLAAGACTWQETETDVAKHALCSVSEEVLKEPLPPNATDIDRFVWMVYHR